MALSDTGGRVGLHRLVTLPAMGIIALMLSPQTWPQVTVISKGGDWPIFLISETRRLTGSIFDHISGAIVSPFQFSGNGWYSVNG